LASERQACMRISAIPSYPVLPISQTFLGRSSKTSLTVENVHNLVLIFSLSCEINNSRKVTITASVKVCGGSYLEVKNSVGFSASR
jgi:hypothetical protein